MASLARVARALAAALVVVLAAAYTPRCAQSQCQLNSDCGRNYRCVANRCVTECLGDRDCPAARPFCSINGECRTTADPDAGAPDARPDATPGMDVPVQPDVPTPPPDVPMPPPDVPMPPPDVPMPPPDVPMPPPDVPMPGRRGYLDGCAGDADCASSMCTARAPRFCTRACARHADCAEGQICAGGRCELDDAGRGGCDPSSAAPCLEFCVGNPRASHCTHSCSTAADCPAGYACSDFGGRRACVDIERPCSAPDQCPTGIGFCNPGGLGCTAQCTSASDCPLRLPGLPPYTCEFNGGVRVCVPPADVEGSDGLGATCSSAGTIRCRSGACDEGTSPPSCNQRCTTRGGCPTGYGCYPLADGGEVLLVCTASGSAWLGETCGRARDCATGLCSLDRYCTRMCTDGLCPTGMTCRDTGVRATDGTPIRLCTR